MLKAVVYLVAPIMLIALFLYVRRRSHFTKYLLFVLPFLVAALSVWLLADDLVFHRYGPKDAEGLRTWAIIAAVGAIALVCAPRMTNRYAVCGQAVVAFLFADIWVLGATWIA